VLYRPNNNFYLENIYIIIQGKKKNIQQKVETGKQKSIIPQSTLISEGKNFHLSNVKVEFRYFNEIWINFIEINR
jgi:hypothetical protein